MQPCTPWLAVPPLDGSTRRERMVRKGAAVVRRADSTEHCRIGRALCCRAATAVRASSDSGAVGGPASGPRLVQRPLFGSPLALVGRFSVDGAPGAQVVAQP